MRYLTDFLFYFLICSGTEYLGPGKSHLAYLPLAHIMELTVEIGTLWCGGHVGYGSPGTVLATSLKMKQTKPPQVRSKRNKRETNAPPERMLKRTTRTEIQPPTELE